MSDADKASLRTRLIEQARKGPDGRESDGNSVWVSPHALKDHRIVNHEGNESLPNIQLPTPAPQFAYGQVFSNP
jgi:hypothetical protein